MLIHPKHFFICLSFAVSIGTYRYAIQRVGASNIPLIFLSIAFGVYLGIISRNWFRRPRTQGMVSGNPRRMRVIKD